MSVKAIDNTSDRWKKNLHQVEKKLKLRKSVEKKSDPDDLVQPIERKTRFWEHQPKKFSSWKTSIDQSLLRKKTLLRSFFGRLKISMENTKQLICDPRIKNSWIDFLKTDRSSYYVKFILKNTQQKEISKSANIR